MLAAAPMIFALLSCGTVPETDASCAAFPRLTFSRAAIRAMSEEDLREVRDFNDKWDRLCRP